MTATLHTVSAQPPTLGLPTHDPDDRRADLIDAGWMAAFAAALALAVGFGLWSLGVGSVLSAVCGACTAAGTLAIAAAVVAGKPLHRGLQGDPR